MEEKTMSAARATERTLGAALAVIGALWGGVAWAQQQADAKNETERLLSQKALMLEVYLGSKRVADALRSGEPKNIEVAKRARADLAEGAEALEKGDLQRAEQSFNAGLRQISTLVLQQGARAEDPAVKKDDFNARRRQINSFMKALEAGTDAASLSPWAGRLAVTRKGLSQAEALFDQEKYAEANAQMASIYADVVTIVGEARRNQSIIYRLTFATPADEYAYELERNKSYEILVDIAIADKQNPDKALQPYIRKLVGQSRELRDMAGAQAASGDHVKAIGTLENASGHLVRALRSAGVTVME
jgi:hypothetical protein